MSLTTYNEKRDFKQTSEPAGKQHKAAGKAKLSFVVQRHKASRLHYDFRLEMDGVLKSWAVPKGPSLNPHDKRLAMMVEDHPYDYKDFEGVIPEGNYGAGIVEIWDSGTYTSFARKEDAKEDEPILKTAFESGDFKFVLNGEKLKGEFVLVRLKDGDGKSWLLIKHRDEYAVDEDYNSEDFTAKDSPINEWLAEHKTGSKRQSKKKP